MLACFRGKVECPVISGIRAEKGEPGALMWFPIGMKRSLQRDGIQPHPNPRQSGRRPLGALSAYPPSSLPCGERLGPSSVMCSSFSDTRPAGQNRGCGKGCGARSGLPGLSAASLPRTNGNSHCPGLPAFPLLPFPSLLLQQGFLKPFSGYEPSGKAQALD